MRSGAGSLVRIFLLGAVSAIVLPVRAESLRCNGHSIEAGDSRISVHYYCGEPLLKDAYCAPVYFAPRLQPVSEPFASAVVPCQLIDEWPYDRGPGNLVAKVRFRSGAVLSIHYEIRTQP